MVMGALLCVSQTGHAAPPQTPRSAHDLAYEAIACWLGPVWGDAIGEPIEQRKANAEQRCRDVVQQTWGDRDLKGDGERLRALESTAIADLTARVDALAKGKLSDDDRKALVSLVRVTAGAQRDNMWARRAADRIRLDETGKRAHQRLNGDEHTALDPLLKSEGLRALLTLDARRFTGDAHALGLLSAMDRVTMARGLPRHLEIYATAPAFQLLFGVAPPAMPADPTVEVLPRVWIGYLTRVAAGAGHPVPDSAALPKDRVRLAWASMIEGIADQLQRTAPRVTDTLRPVVDGAARRLKAESIADRNAFALEQRQRSTPRTDLSSRQRP
jgi:hypothetical protein